jgi:hypothetical protein
MSTNSRLDMNFCGRVNSGRVSWAEAMSIYSKLDVSLGGWLDRRGEIGEKPPQLPLINLRYRKGCAISPNGTKAYSIVVCFFVLRKNL